jgi:DNA polymerase elongation subunit (family B)
LECWSAAPRTHTLPQEYNICFTTVERPLHGFTSLPGSGAPVKKGKAEPAPMPAEADDDGNDATGAAAAAEEALSSGVLELPALPDRSKFPDLAVLPLVIQSLVRRRQAVKRMLKTEKNPIAQQALDIRQKALKILANSMYGCLGFAQSRFYARPLAALVTSQGREILQRTCELAQVSWMPSVVSLLSVLLMYGPLERRCVLVTQDVAGLDVVYGDTDSIFLATNLLDYAQAREKGMIA